MKLSELNMFELDVLRKQLKSEIVEIPEPYDMEDNNTWDEREAMQAEHNTTYADDIAYNELLHIRIAQATDAVKDKIKSIEWEEAA